MWRMKGFCHYGLAETNPQWSTDETIKYDYYTAQFEGRHGQFYGAEAFYVCDQTAYDHLRSWKIALKDACIAMVLGSEDLFASSLRNALKTCPVSIQQRVHSAFDDEKRSELMQVLNPLLPDNIKSESFLSTLRAEIGRIKNELELVRIERDSALQRMNAVNQCRSYRRAARLRMIADFVRGN